MLNKHGILCKYTSKASILYIVCHRVILFLLSGYIAVPNNAIYFLVYHGGQGVKTLQTLTGPGQ